MNTAGDAAEQIVKMSLGGVEVAAKIAGTGAKELAMMIYAIAKDQKKTKGIKMADRVVHEMVGV